MALQLLDCSGHQTASCLAHLVSLVE